jgi:hypothetical protein
MLIEFSSYFLIYFGFDEEAYKLLDTIKKKWYNIIELENSL